MRAIGSLLVWGSHSASQWVFPLSASQEAFRRPLTGRRGPVSSCSLHLREKEGRFDRETRLFLARRYDEKAFFERIPVAREREA